MRGGEGGGEFRSLAGGRRRFVKQGRFEAPRYWIPEGKEIPLYDAGFMPDPEGPFGAGLPDTRSLDQLRDTNCLVLIGEPGLGKTTAMEAEYRSIATSLSPEDRALLVELGFTRVGTELREAIFGSNEFTEWLESEGRLFLFLDSLDEARVRIEHVAKLLLQGLEGVPFGRLVFRLSCRSADRHPNLEAELRQRFGVERFEVRELAPLTRSAICGLAATRGLDGAVFVREVISKELQPLAMVPETLKFLLSVTKESGALPERRVEAFEQGLLLLAQEPDEDRRVGITAGRLSASERIAICARVAGALILSGRSVVRTDQGAGGPDEASLAELTGGRELDRHVAVERRIDVDEQALREALGSAIMTAAGGQGRLAFAQASYAEFLTARWLADGGLSPAQRRALLFSAVQERVVPQLHEVATWLAGLSPSFHRELLDADPLVLLRAEPGGLDDGEKARVIDALFAGVRSFEIERWDRRMKENYGTLGHPAIADQLAAVIFETTEEPIAREVGCDVAAACGVAELVEQIGALALDREADLQLRGAALGAMRTLAEPKQLKAFRSLALEEQEEDVDDELKGAALRLLWPDELGVDELLGALSPPRRDHLLGAYRSFLSNELVANLGASDLPSALRWAARLPVSHSPFDDLGDVRQELLVAAWPCLVRDAEVRDAYLAVVAKMLDRGAALLSPPLREKHPEVFVDPAPRRILLEGLITMLGEGRIGHAGILFATPRLIGPEDFDWLIGRLRGAVGGERERPLAELVNRLPSLGASEFDVLEARDESPVLAGLSARFDPIEIDSPEAEEAQRIFEMTRRLDREEEEEGEQEDIDIPGHVSDALDDLAAGNLDGYWIATKWLEIDERRERQFFVSDLRALTGWDLITEVDRERLRTATPRYLAEADPKPERWFGKGSIYWPAWAGYRGLRLLADLDPTLFESLGDEIWERWAPAIVNWPREGMNETGEPAFNDAMMVRLHATVPTAASVWVGRLLDRQLRFGHAAIVLGRLDDVWDRDLEAAIMKGARRSRLDPKKRTELLRFLVAKGSTAALEHAHRLVTPGALAAGGRRRTLALEVAAMLAAERGAVDWERTWGLMQADESFGRDLVGRLAQDETQIAVNLPATEAADLYLWVEERYPGREDPWVEGAHSPSVREEIGTWRGRIAGVIAAQGTREAVEALGRLVRELPEYLGLRRYKRDAEEILERAEWEPPRPQEVIVLSEDSRRRYVRSARDLKRLLLGSLARAQERLGGQMPQAPFLWDSRPLRPKGERLVAAWLEQHLRDDLAGRGIFVGRELEIRVNPKGHMGESVDIFTEAVVGPEVEGAATVRVVTELKCCWHEDLDMAMRGQLVDRYLDGENDQGIYLVAYFDSPDWDDSDAPKRGRCRARTLEESRSFFAGQAAEINSEGTAEVGVVVLDCRLGPQPPDSGAIVPARDE
jgi:hypothetical protein